MTSEGSNRRPRRPQLAVAERIARRLYDGVAAVEWVPSDEADVFRLTFSSGLEPRYLKLPLPGTRVVWREVVMLPALRARGFPVHEFEHCRGDRADPGAAFHVTREMEHVPARSWWPRTRLLAIGSRPSSASSSAASRVSTPRRFPAACAGIAIHRHGGGPSAGR